MRGVWSLNPGGTSRHSLSGRRAILLLYSVIRTCTVLVQVVHYLAVARSLPGDVLASLPTYRTVPTYCIYTGYIYRMRPGTIYRIRREQGEVMSRLDLPCLLSTSRLALRLPLFLLNPPSTLLSPETLTLRSLNAGSLL